MPALLFAAFAFAFAAPAWAEPGRVPSVESCADGGRCAVVARGDIRSGQIPLWRTQ